jgi:hypothetical protein
MKKYVRLSTIVFIILALLLSTLPASAKAEKKTITGTCELVAFPPWIGDLEQSPDFRWWEPGGKESWRNQAVMFLCNFNDDRLNGYFYALDNWNNNHNENSNFLARSFGKAYMSDAYGNDLGLWDISGVGWTDAEGGWGLKQVWKGRGMYQGLTVKATWIDIGFPFYQLDGELLVP